MKKRLKFVLGSLLFLGIFSGCVQKKSEHPIIAHKEESEHQDVNAVNYATEELKAYDLATRLVVEKLQEPKTAQFPSKQKRSEHIRSLGGKRFRIDSWVDSQDTYGAMTRKRFSLLFKMDSSRIIKEKFEIESHGEIPKMRYQIKRKE